jgi:hypothetical protein
MMFKAILHTFKRKMNKRKRICITTYFDEKFAPIGNLCYKTLQIYGAQHKLDVVLSNNIVSGRPAPWHKILVMRQLFASHYDYVFWIDADAIFIDYQRNIADEIEADKELYLVKHNIDSKEIPNTGVILIKNSEWSHKLLSQIWEKQEYINHKWWENAALIDILGYHDLLNENSHKKLNLDLLKRIKWLGLEWNSLPKICESEHSLIRHYAGRSFEDRMASMLHNFQSFQKID